MTYMCRDLGEAVPRAAPTPPNTSGGQGLLLPEYRLKLAKKNVLSSLGKKNTIQC